jgi:peroxiredoxin
MLKQTTLLGFLLFLNLGVRSQNVTQPSIKISGELEFAKNSPAILDIMYIPLSQGRRQFDSCKVINGQFTILKQSDNPVIVVIGERLKRSDPSKGNGNQDYYSALLTPGEVKFIGRKNLHEAEVLGTGAIANNDYQNFLAKENDYINLSNKLVSPIYAHSISMDEKEKRATRILDSINLIRDQELYLHTIREKPQSLIALVALINYANAPVWRPRKKVDPESIEKLLADLPASLMSYPMVAELKQELRISKSTGTGKPFINFTLKDTSGKAVQLSDFKGKYIFLDFWASWCAPCRKENPNVKKQFELYRDKGFTVLSVSLDVPSARQAWLEAIRKDQIGLWSQLNDTEGFKGQVAQQYYIQSIPTNFLIGPDGKFLGRNLYGEELDKTLAKLFTGR